MPNDPKIVREIAEEIVRRCYATHPMRRKIMEIDDVGFTEHALLTYGQQEYEKGYADGQTDV